MITIIDYGMSNLRSVQKAFEAVGHEATVTSDPDQVRRADHLILPGVGAFADSMAELNRSGLGQAFLEAVQAGKPCLGVCVGMQVLFEYGLENGRHAGLGLFSGTVERLAIHEGLKIPHMGWNSLRIRQPAPLFAGLPDQPSVYFVHSYVARPSDPTIIAAEADYPDPFVAAVWKDNLLATQFHPEKSQRLGLAMYANFAKL